MGIEKHLNPQDDAAIRECLRAREQGDSRSPDLDWENAFGVRKRGLAEVLQFINERVRPTVLNAVDTILDVRIEQITTDVAVADEYWLLVGQADPSTGETLPDRRGRTTLVLRKEGGEWTIVLERVADLRSRPRSPK